MVRSSMIPTLQHDLRPPGGEPTGLDLASWASIRESAIFSSGPTSTLLEHEPRRSRATRDLPRVKEDHFADMCDQEGVMTTKVALTLDYRLFALLAFGGWSVA
ncbi:hypothetical protein EDD16DRAFT_1728665 [Pisolithus croceorrhizus]|nr:hypothetical protein EDD16DRAFT_1728665 [Pisolithus croceorrhizus]